MPVHTVTPNTLKIWLEKKEAVVIDVREPAEFAEGHIEGAVLLPVGGITKASLPAMEGKKLVFHCRGGKRGTTACEKILAEDPTLDLYHLEGGFVGWQSAGYVCTNNARGCAQLPLENQVLLVVGILVLLSVALGFLVNSLFFFLTGLIGCALIFAGLTGICALSVLLAKMPWNRASVSFCATRKS